MKDQDKKAALAALAVIAAGVVETFRGYWNLGIALAPYSDLKQTVLAEELGCSQSTVSRAFMLNGKFSSYEKALAAFEKSGKTSVLGFLATLSAGKASSEPKAVTAKAACLKASKAPYFEALPENIKAAILAHCAL